MTDILILGILLTLGVIGGLGAQKIGLPRVAGYVVVGALCCEDLLGGLVNIQIHGFSHLLTDAALGVIAYDIGGSITKEQLRKTGAVIAGCAVSESLGAALCVFLGVYIFAPPLPGLETWQTALIFAAIAPATAPAGTVAVLRQYGAKGPLSQTLLGVVALDDAVGILLFALLAAVSAGTQIMDSLGHALVETGGALVLGAVMGRALAATHMLGHLPIRLPIILGSVCFTVGTSLEWNVSPLLACMAMGFSTRWASPERKGRLFAPLAAVEELIFVLFFTIAGAHFQFGAFASSVGIVLIYCVMRAIGKMSGAAAGARLTGAPPVVSRWLGLTLLPQAGVAIGLALSVGRYPTFENASTAILNVVLAATIINELLGPIAARYALSRAGEIE